MKNLLNKKILLIICGGISAYKSLETIRLFKKNGAEIKTILTNSAKEFVTPLSVASLSQGKVYSDYLVLKMKLKWIILLYQDGLM
jgi:phosphopantothenoylcysteine decarboxylase/phosphopantothenate--cysteine ligase